MNLNISLFSIILIFTQLSCSSSAEKTQFDINSYKGTSSKFISSPNLEITIPDNWREIKDNQNQIFEIWLINDANNATICFLPITIDQEIPNSGDNLKLIEKILINKKKNSFPDFKIINISDELIKHSAKIIIYESNEGIQNSIIFGNGRNYYECLAYFKKNYVTEDSEADYIFEIQKRIILGSTIK